MRSLLGLRGSGKRCGKGIHSKPFPFAANPPSLPTETRPPSLELRLVSSCPRPEPCAEFSPPLLLSQRIRSSPCLPSTLQAPKLARLPALVPIVASFAVGMEATINRVFASTADNRACDIGPAHPAGDVCFGFSATWPTAEYPSVTGIASILTAFVVAGVGEKLTTAATVTCHNRYYDTNPLQRIWHRLQERDKHHGHHLPPPSPLLPPSVPGLLHTQAPLATPPQTDYYAIVSSASVALAPATLIADDRVLLGGNTTLDAGGALSARPTTATATSSAVTIAAVAPIKCHHDSLFDGAPFVTPEVALAFNPPPPPNPPHRRYQCHHRTHRRRSR